MALLQDLIRQINDPTLRDRILQETDKVMKQKKFGLVFEEHLPECTPLHDVPIRVGSKVALKTGYVSDIYMVIKLDGNEALCDRRETHEKVTFQLDEIVAIAEYGEPIYPTLKPLDVVQNAPDSDLWHTLIEADNYHALQLLEYLYAEKVDCIYIDPPYNTGAKDWKYNNDYVDGSDAYRHSKWLSMMEKRLKIAKRLLNPKDSVLIVTIDEKEYLHLGCLLEEIFSDARIQMVSSVINSAGVTRGDEFSRSNEYLFFVKMGSSSPVALPLYEDWRGHTKTEKKEALVWNQLMRSGTGARRVDRPNMFYPLFINEEGTRIIKIGEPLAPTEDRRTVQPIEGTRIVWPIRSNGEEGRWRIGRENLISIYEKGYVRLGAFTDKGMALTYLANGEQKKIEEGTFSIIGHREDGSIIEGDMEIERTYIPGTQWDIPSHNATYLGSQLLNKILGEKRFDFPKSLYAVHDTLRFFVANKPDALIVDFFAGSGTTLHAVNLLNAEYGGQRRCIMVTNNEVSEEEARRLSERGVHPGDEEWERLGIARYVTWERTKCSINGENVRHEPLQGDYGTDHDIYIPDDDATLVSKSTGRPVRKKIYIKKKELDYATMQGMKMADGFKANAAFFKLSFLDKTSVALGRQFRELLPVLWMKGGAIGKCPVLENDGLPNMLILPQNKMAVLVDEIYYSEFDAELSQHPEIQTVFIVTDSETAYRSMIRTYDGKDCYQLYRDYLDNFRINTGR